LELYPQPLLAILVCPLITLLLLAAQVVAVLPIQAVAAQVDIELLIYKSRYLQTSQ
jgi:hypothetical protein